MGKFSESLGIWKVENVDGGLELRPKMKDVRSFRNLMMKNSKDKSLLFDSFINYMWELIERDYKEDAQLKNSDGDNELRLWLELNVNTLFEEAMIVYRWTTREDLVTSKKEQLSTLKKKMSEN